MIYDWFDTAGQDTKSTKFLNGQQIAGLEEYFSGTKDIFRAKKIRPTQYFADFLNVNFYNQNCCWKVLRKQNRTKHPKKITKITK